MNPLQERPCSCCYGNSYKPSKPKTQIKINIQEKKGPTHIRNRTWKLRNGKIGYDEICNDSESISRKQSHVPSEVSKTRKFSLNIFRKSEGT